MNQPSPESTSTPNAVSVAKPGVPRIVVTFQDVRTRKRKALLSAAFPDEKQKLAAYNELPVAEGYSTFVATVRNSGGDYSHRPVDYRLLEGLAAKSISELLHAARSNRPLLINGPSQCN